MKKILSLILCVILAFSCVVSVGAYSFSNNGTATKKATAYRLPSVNSGDIWWVDKNDKLQVFCQDGDYYLVLYPFNNTGKHVIAYVPTSAVSASGIPNASNFYKNEIVRTKSNANLYHNPSTDTLTGASGSNQTVRTTVSKGQELTVLFEKEGFYCVRTLNDTGFIEKNKICTHSNVSKQKTSSGNATKINDASYHEIKITYKEVCNECGIINRENISETEREKHSISNDKCTKCGYEVPIVEEKCNHSNTKESWQSSTVSQKSDTYHTVEEIYDVLCVDCGEALKKSQKKTYDEKHLLKNDECEKCSYVVPGTEASICKHKNTAKHSSDDMKTTISIKDDNQHTIASYYHVWCTDCFTYIKENELDLVHENHTFVNNICSVCNLEKIVDKPAATTLKVSKNSFTPGETISLNWAAAKGAMTYDIHINKSGQSSRYRLDSGFTGTSGTLKINDEGTYTLTIYSVNSGGFTSGSSVTITVKKATTERAAWVVTDGRRLNFRKGPSTGYGVWYLLDPGTSVTVTGDAVSGLYPIKHNATTGYVSSDCLTFTKPAITTSNLSTNTNYVWPSSGGYHVTVLEYYWGKVSSGAHPTKGNGSIKGAIDIGTAGNALATASGTVAEVQYSSAKTGWGNTVTIRHNDGTYSFYAHLAKINVSKNQKVTAGQNIGVIGATGYSQGVHLHFEIWDSSKNTIYTINAFKDKYKKNLRFDSDIVSGGSNNSTIRQWIKDNYKLSGKIYIAK